MAGPARSHHQNESLLAAAAAGGHSMMVLNTDDLARLLHQLGGGLSSGNTALGNSLHAQSATITAQNEQIRGLLSEVDRLSRRCAELEQSNLGVKTFDAKVALAHRQLDQDARQNQEMMGLLKIAAVTIAQNVMGGGDLDLSALLGGGGVPLPAGAAKKPKPAAPKTPAAAAGAANDTGDEPDTDDDDGLEEAAAASAMPTPATLGEALKAIVSRLSPETIDTVLAEAELPNPDIPGETPTLVAVLQLLLGALSKETLDQLRSELGPEMMQRLFTLLMAHGPRPPGASS